MGNRWVQLPLSEGVSLCMNGLSLTLKWRDLVAIGLHVGNMFVNREALPIDAAETAYVMFLGKGITRPCFVPPPG